MRGMELLAILTWSPNVTAMLTGLKVVRVLRNANAIGGSLSQSDLCRLAGHA
jgi:hypothetical protein